MHSEELVPYFEGPLAQMRELERQLHAQEIDAELAKPPPKACCAGGCGCGAKLQLLVRKDDVPRVAHYLKSEWLAAVAREGVVPGLTQLGVPAESDAPEGELTCPACSFTGALVEGACGDCGLQLE